MMTIKLQPKYFDYVKNGAKRIELRLNDEKRQLIKIGDEIEILKEPNLDESFTVKVIGLLKYSCFEDLFKDFDISILADKSEKKQDVLKDLEKYYSKEKQAEYNVLGIRFELI
ncbi:MAG: ASCH domain-containing protein [Clostridiales bacterium]|nr:ASCH domain-containing protein [Clostridiales bacterium]